MEDKTQAGGSRCHTGVIGMATAPLGVLPQPATGSRGGKGGRSPWEGGDRLGAAGPI